MTGKQGEAQVKLVGLATAFGAATAFVGIGGSAIPASAEIGDFVCYSAEGNDERYYVLMSAELYNEDQGGDGCSKLIQWSDAAKRYVEFERKFECGNTSDSDDRIGLSYKCLYGGTTITTDIWDDAPVLLENNKEEGECLLQLHSGYSDLPGYEDLAQQRVVYRESDCSRLV